MEESALNNHGLLQSHCHMEEHSHIPPPNVYCASLLVNVVNGTTDRIMNLTV